MSDKLIFTLDKDNFLDLPDFVEEIRNNQNLHYVIILVGWCLSNIAIITELYKSKKLNIYAYICIEC